MNDKITGYIAAALAGAAITGAVCWWFMDYSRQDILKLGEEFSMIGEVRDTLHEANYPIGDNDTTADMINGYLKANVDEYTYYYVEEDPDTFQTSYINSSGTAVASGFQVDRSEDGNILITEVTDGLPADKQGLKKGDIITHINGESVSENGYADFADKIMGKDETHVTLTISRNGESFELDFVRANKTINQCEFERIGDAEYIRIKCFTQLMVGQYSKAIGDAETADKIIIDLRDCPGGEIISAVEIAADLSGSATVQQIYYSGEVYTEEKTCDEPKAVGKKIAVLINENTASSGEILAALLKQNLDAVFVGTNTYGKGIFQDIKELADGGKLQYTAGYTSVGDWENWQGVGIAPDVEIEMNHDLIGTDDDIQLKKALEVLE